MAWSYEALVTELHSRYGAANAHRAALNTNITAAWLDWTGDDDHACLYDVLQGMQAILDCFVDMFAKNYYGYNGSTYLIPTMLDPDKACPFITEAEPFTLTMGDVIDVMLSADFDELQFFIGIVDAYRMSLWNKPFNSELFAALARGFE